MRCDFRVLAGRRVCAAVVLGATLVPGALLAQYKSPAERIQDLEKANEELRARIEALEREMSEAAAKERPGAEKAPGGAPQPLFANGVLTIGGVNLELGGSAELLLIDPQEEDDPIAGRTENPDPHFELDQLRIEPVLRFSRAISVHGQIDFEPTDGDTVLKELTARYAPEPFAWWFDAEVRLGLDDRFIRPARRTENYPLVGNAFWRWESLALTASVSLGDKDGPQAVGGG
ncbi:MAG: bZIP transcription factor, partial [Planctomycetota bacterium]